MEIDDYVRAVSRRSRFVVVVALAALALSVVSFFLEPPKYRATATVVIPSPTGVSSLIAGVSQAVSDFDGALTSDSVAARVSAATGIDKGDIESGLSFDRLTSSSVAEVSFEGNTQEQAQLVVEVASREALSLLLAARLAPLEQRRTVATDSYQQIEAEYQAFLAETGLLDPEQYFRQQTSRLISLKDALGVAKAEGNEEETASLEARITTKQAELSKQVVDYERLAAGRQLWLGILVDVEGDYTTAQAALNSAQDANTVSVAAAVRVSQVGVLIRTVIPAVVVATGLAIGFVVLLELSRPPRRAATRQMRQTGGPPVAEAAPPQAAPPAVDPPEAAKPKARKQKAGSGNGPSAKEPVDQPSSSG